VTPAVATALAMALAAAAVLTWPGLRLKPPARPWRLLARRETARRSAASRTELLLQVIEAVAAQVRGGAVPSLAWDAAVDVMGGPGDELPRARGEPLAEVLRRSGPGDRVVLSVAAAWALADDVGAPLADLLDELGAGLRAEAEVDAEVDAALAGPRATAQLLAVLPVAGIGLGELIGAEPLSVLLTTPVGRLSGAVGIALAVGGQLWTRRLVARVAAVS
jgi:tight adherence protein B